MKKRIVIVLAAAAFCMVQAGCTTGPHPSPTPNQPTPPDGKDSHPVKATTSGPHPAKE